MKRIITKRFSIVFLGLLLCLSLYACGRKAEAVISGDEDDLHLNEYPTLEASNSKKFDYSDLSVNSLKYFMTEDEVKKVCGNPVSVHESSEKNLSLNLVYAEKVYSYNDLTLIFMKMDNNGKGAGASDEGIYRLTAAASVSDKDIFSRGLKVGDSVEDILDVYYRDSDYPNNYYKSADETVVIGKFLYGEFTMDELDKISTKEAISYGLLNFNGYASLESAENYIVEFTYFSPDYKNGTATVEDNFAQIAFDIDSDGKITSIRWYYYPEEG